MSNQNWRRFVFPVCTILLMATAGTAYVYWYAVGDNGLTRAEIRAVSSLLAAEVLDPQSLEIAEIQGVRRRNSIDVCGKFDARNSTGGLASGSVFFATMTGDRARLLASFIEGPDLDSDVVLGMCSNAEIMIAPS